MAILNYNAEYSLLVSDKNPTKCLYGWRDFRPRFLQRFASQKWLVIFTMMVIFASGTVHNGIIPANISTLQRRFHLKSTDFGFMNAMSAVAVSSTGIPVAFIAENGNKVRWIAATSTIVGIGALISTLPHYLIEPYLLEERVSSQDDTESFCSTNDPISKCGSSSVDGSNMALILFYIGFVVIALGVTTHNSVLLAYVDENLSQSASVRCLGILAASAFIGYGFGSGLQGYFLTYNTDIDRKMPSEIHAQLGDSNWYGAWWLGFLVMGITVLLSVIPFSGLPQELPDRKATRATDIDQVQCDFDGSMNQLSQILSGLWTIFSNRMIFFCTCYRILDAFIVTGLMYFFPKYLESNYGYEPQVAAVLPGLIALLPSILGNIACGHFAHKMGLQLRGLLIMALVTSSIMLALDFPFLLPCQSAQMAGVNVPYPATRESVKQLDASCNSNCHCSLMAYNPVCGPDGVSYYSPCFAGCQGYSNCSCLAFWDRSAIDQFDGQKLNALPNSALDTTVHHGLCPIACGIRRWLFCIFVAIGCFVGSSTGTLLTQTYLRGVPHQMRGVVLSVTHAIIMIIGVLPSGPLMGYIFDSSCILWKPSCSSAKTCVLYNSQKLALTYVAMGFTTRILSNSSLYMALKSYREPSRHSKACD